MIVKLISPFQTVSEGSAYRTKIIKEFIESGGKFKDLYYRYWSFYPYYKIARHDFEKLSLFYFMIKHNAKIRFSLTENKDDTIAEIDQLGALYNSIRFDSDKKIKNIPILITFYTASGEEIGSIKYPTFIYLYKENVIGSQVNWTKFRSSFHFKNIAYLDIIIYLYDIFYSYIVQHLNDYTTHPTLSNKIDNMLITHSFARRLYKFDEYSSTDLTTFDRLFKMLIECGNRFELQEKGVWTD